jgi:hypothetical protein
MQDFWQVFTNPTTAVFSLVKSSLEALIFG